MDLSPYICRGFPGDFDRAMANVNDAGIDREQTLGMIRFCPETESFLYEEYSPTRIRYRRGARPELEQVAAGFSGSPRQRIAQAMDWVSKTVRHAHFVGDVRPDRAFSEEKLIESHCGWCNEQVRVFISLCEVMEHPARLCFLFHKNNHTAHTAAEVYLDGKWAFHDVTYRVRVELPDGTLAEARQLQGKWRPLAHAAYREPLEDYYRRGVRPKGDNAPPVETGGDYLESIAIYNYLIEGVEQIHE